MGAWSDGGGGGGNGGHRPRTVHPFPARMSAGLARGLIEGVERERSAAGTDDGPMTIVDPMVGSGTVLGAARDRGHKAIGFDVDPLAVLISGVGHCGGHLSDRAVCDEAGRVLADARDVAARGSGGHDCDGETLAFIQYWFDEAAARQLGALAARIRTVDDPGTRNVLWCAFSRLIIAKQASASRAADLAHSRPHRKFEKAPRMPFEWFSRSVQAILAAMPRQDAAEHPSVSVAVGDAKRLAMPSGSADMVLTSPPYVNAIDYLRCSKFSLVWMGYGIGRLRGIRSDAIGTEVGLDGAKTGGETYGVVRAAVNEEDMRVLGNRRLHILERYANDMMGAAREIARVVKDGGVVAFVVGVNTMHGIRVRTPELVRAASERAGLITCAIRYRDIPASGRYLPPPSDMADPATSALGSRMRREAIISMKKL